MKKQYCLTKIIVIVLFYLSNSDQTVSKYREREGGRVPLR